LSICLIIAGSALQAITFIVQVRKFEFWLISDIDSLKSANLIDSNVENIEDSDIVQSQFNGLKTTFIIEGCV